MRVNSRLTRSIAVIAATFTAIASVFAGGIPVQAQEDDIDTAVVHSYVVQPEEARVAVSTTLAVTADKPNRSTNRGVTQYYFNGWYATIPAEATELTVTDNGRDLVYERIEEGEVSTLDITFRRNIFYRQTANIEINYVLPSDGPRSEAAVQVNPAYAGFPVFDGTSSEEVGITIEFPAGFGENEGFGLESLERRVEDDGRVIFENLNVPLYEAAFGFVAAANTDSLRIEPFEVDDLEFELRAWPGDSEWSNFVRDQITEGTPLLAAMTGLEWPIEDVLEITESYSPYLSGYGGWYDSEDTSIEIGDELDEHLIFHELGHVWFNDDLFVNRWITEGLADEFADALIEDLDGDRRDAPRASNLDDNAIPLSHWSNVPPSREVEEWAYEASWKVMSEIADEVGIETIGAAVQAADEGLTAYPGETDFKSGARVVTDWRYFLDLLELDVESGSDDLTDLFADWVVGKSISFQLDDRLEARTTYVELAEAGGEWAAPVGVRATMSEWKFNSAKPIMAAAAEQLNLRNEVVEAIAELDVAFPDGYEARYEDAAAVEDLEQVGLDLAGLKVASQQLVLAHETADAEPTLFTKIGLIGQDVSSQITQIDASFEANELVEVAQGGDELEATLVDAESAGKLRAALAGGLALLVIMLFWLLRRRKKNKTKQDLQQETQPVAADVEAVQPEPAVTEAPPVPALVPAMPPTPTQMPVPPQVPAQAPVAPQAAMGPAAPTRPETRTSLPWDTAPELPPRPNHRTPDGLD